MNSDDAARHEVILLQHEQLESQQVWVLDNSIKDMTEIKGSNLLDGKEEAINKLESS
jgi:hypothetical protein